MISFSFFFTLSLFTLLGSNAVVVVLAQSTVDFSSVRVTGDRETNDLVYLQFDAHLMPMEQNWRCTADLGVDMDADASTSTSTSAPTMMGTKTGTCDFLDVKGMAFQLSFSLRDPLPMIGQTAGAGGSYSLTSPLVLDFTYSFGVASVEPVSFATEMPMQYLMDGNVAINPSTVSLSNQEVVSVDAMGVNGALDIVSNQ